MWALYSLLAGRLFQLIRIFGCTKFNSQFKPQKRSKYLMLNVVKTFTLSYGIQIFKIQKQNKKQTIEGHLPDISRACILLLYESRLYLQWSPEARYRSNLTAGALTSSQTSVINITPCSACAKQFMQLSAGEYQERLHISTFQNDLCSKCLHGSYPRFKSITNTLF